MVNPVRLTLVAMLCLSSCAAREPGPPGARPAVWCMSNTKIWLKHDAMFTLTQREHREHYTHNHQYRIRCEEPGARPSKIKPLRLPE